jgi:hypothetical protein
MIEIVGPSYLRGLAVRCLTAARDCFDRCAKEEFRNWPRSSRAKLMSSNARDIHKGRKPTEIARHPLSHDIGAASVIIGRGARAVRTGQQKHFRDS